MATSGETTWTRTAGDIITDAMVELGVISLGMEPEASEYEGAVSRLNGYLQELDVEGLMFREGSGTVTIPAGTGGVTLSDDIGEVSSARFVVSATQQRPLQEWNRSEYYMLPNRAQTAQQPMAYTIKKSTAGTELLLWPVPTGDVTLHLDYLRPTQVVTAPDETVDIPQKWYNTVMMNLASRCASMFGSARLDPQNVARIDARAGQLQQRMLDDDRPNSYRFEPYNA
jgi:hypothetical protein